MRRSLYSQCPSFLVKVSKYRPAARGFRPSAEGRRKKKSVRAVAAPPSIYMTVLAVMCFPRRSGALVEANASDISSRPLETASPIMNTPSSV